MSGRLDYRHDVDGLRAIAVLFVFLFHLDFDFVRGGFVGVDIFYVISGFVIFRGMLDRPRYDFAFVRGFYARRWRRIVPALMTTILGSIAVGAIVLTPEEYMALAKSALATMFFVSNIYFNDTLSYFADGVRSMPLLHTWSLGVEEQFYLIVPWLVLAFGGLKQKRGIVVVLLATTVLSFAYNIYASYFIFDERHAFYLPMPRFWEIGCGALAAVAERRWAPSPRVSAALAAAGAAGLVASALLIDSTMSFPGFAAVLPVASASAMILAQPRGDSLTFRVMASKLATFFGHISYSLYLLHWPVIIYVGLLAGRELSVPEKWIVLAATTAAAFVSWRFIEEPFRHARASGRSMWRLTGAGALITLAVCLVVIGTRGLPVRLNEEARRVADWREAPVDPSEMHCPPHPDFAPVKRAGICALGDPAKPADFVLWGDSHAGMYSMILGHKLRDDGYNGVVAVMSDCPPVIGVHSSKRKNRAECVQLATSILDKIRTKHVRIVILSSRWANMGSPVRAPGDGTLPKRIFRDSDGREISFTEALEMTVDTLTRAGAKVLIIGPSPEMQYEVPNALTRALQLHLALPPMSRQTFDRRQTYVMAGLAKVATAPNVTVVYPHEVLCNAQDCRSEKNNLPFYIDDDHLSREGVQELLPAIEAAFLRLAAD